MPLVPNAHERMTKRQEILINVLIVIFGISAWIGVNGIFVQLPLLVTTAPEGWSLPAYITIAIQTANVGPALYVLVQKFAPHLCEESLWISGLLISGTTAMGFLAFFYDTNTDINGVEHSVVFLALVFATALVGCSSSVIFLPYLKNFQEIQLVYFFIGEGLSGVLSSALALIQGVGGDPPCSPNTASNSTVDNEAPVSMPSFSLKVYFLFVFGVLAVSTCAFRYLESLRNADRYQIVSTSAILNQPSTFLAGDHSNKTTLSNEISNLESSLPTEVSEILDPPNTYSCVARSYLYLLIGLMSFGSNGFLPGIQSYSCLPYGSVAYHLTITLVYLSNPVACALALWLPSPGLRVITGVATLALAAASHVTWLAFSSPTPPWRDTITGVVLVVVVWVVLTGLVTYAKVEITAIFKREPEGRSLFYVGTITQAASTTGAIISFGLINYTTILVPYSACAPPN